MKSLHFDGHLEVLVKHLMAFCLSMVSRWDAFSVLESVQAVPLGLVAACSPSELL